MNFSLATADRTTHVKIVVVALFASLAVMIVGIAARPQAEAPGAVVKAGGLLVATGAASSTVR